MKPKIKNCCEDNPVTKKEINLPASGTYDRIDLNTKTVKTYKYKLALSILCFLKHVTRRCRRFCESMAISFGCRHKTVLITHYSRQHWSCSGDDPLTWRITCLIRDAAYIQHSQDL